MQVCPNCGVSVEAGKQVCPNCGAALPPPGASAPVWPPPPAGSVPPLQMPPSQPHLLTKSVVGDFALGAVLSLASMFVGGLGIIVMPILYFVLRPSAPVFARGIGYGFLASLVLLLGAFALCIFGMASRH